MLHQLEHAWAYHGAHGHLGGIAAGTDTSHSRSGSQAKGSSHSQNWPPRVIDMDSVTSAPGSIQYDTTLEASWFLVATWPSGDSSVKDQHSTPLWYNQLVTGAPNCSDEDIAGSETKASPRRCGAGASTDGAIKLKALGGGGPGQGRTLRLRASLKGRRGHHRRQGHDHCNSDRNQEDGTASHGLQTMSETAPFFCGVGTQQHPSSNRL